MEIIPFDKRIGFIWYNGEFVEWQNATTHVLNHGLHYGSCVLPLNKLTIIPNKTNSFIKGDNFHILK